MAIVSPVSLSQLKTFFTGPTPSNLQAYYKGGLYVPASSILYEPGPAATQENYSLSATTYYSYNITVTGIGYTASNGFIWAGVSIPVSYTGGTSGAYTYYYMTAHSGGTVTGTSGTQTTTYYGVRRTSTTVKNASVPTSGSISFSQLLGATL